MIEPPWEATFEGLGPCSSPPTSRQKAGVLRSTDLNVAYILRWHSAVQRIIASLNLDSQIWSPVFYILATISRVLIWYKLTCTGIALFIVCIIFHRMKLKVLLTADAGHVCHLKITRRHTKIKRKRDPVIFLVYPPNRCTFNVILSADDCSS